MYVRLLLVTKLEIEKIVLKTLILREPSKRSP